METTPETPPVATSELAAVFNEFAATVTASAIPDGRFGDTVRAALEGLQNREEHLFDTGIPELNRNLAGLRGLTVLGGKQGAGKTTLALQLAAKAARSNVPVLFVSAEMAPDALQRRLMEHLHPLPGQHLKHHFSKAWKKETHAPRIPIADLIERLNECESDGSQEWQKQMKAALDLVYIGGIEQLKPSPEVYASPDKPTITTVEALAGELDAIKVAHGRAAFVVVDSLHALVAIADGLQNSEERLRIGELMQGFRAILNVELADGILLISHLNRESNKAGETESHSYLGSSSIEYIVDNALQLERMYVAEKDGNGRSIEFNKLKYVIPDYLNSLGCYGAACDTTIRRRRQPLRIVRLKTAKVRDGADFDTTLIYTAPLHRMYYPKQDELSFPLEAPKSEPTD